MDLQLQLMDQFLLQLSTNLKEFQSIPSPKKFTLQNMEEEISEDGIEHPKLLELLLAWDFHYICIISISSMMELYSSQVIMDYTNFLQMVKHKK